jgi:hypothetical protein
MGRIVNYYLIFKGKNMSITQKQSAGYQAEERMQKRRSRTIESRGKAQTADEFGLEDWVEYRIFDPEYAGKARLWTPGGTKTIFDDGHPMVFRFLPALSCDEPDSNAYTTFAHGRDQQTGELSLEMIRTTGFVERFGVEKTVSFIPSMVYQPEDGYEPFSGPKDNPYKLLLDGIYMMKASRSLPRSWTALGFNKKEIEAWCQERGFPSKYAKSLLPGISYKKFAYAWIYRGYDLRNKKEISCPDKPIGSNPSDGFQIVCFSNSVYDALAEEYAALVRQEGEVNTNVYQCPEPAYPTRGCLNYVWNKQKGNPVTGRAPGDGIGYGYTAYASPKYYSSPNHQVRAHSLQLSDDFCDWYFDEWVAWDRLLHGTTGVEQVRLIAEFFPELGPVCEQMWDGYDTLLAAWEKAPFIKEKIDMTEIMYRKFRPVNAKDKTNSQRVVASDSDQFDEEDYEPTERPRQQERRERREQREQPSGTSQRSRLDAGFRDAPARNTSARNTRQTEDDYDNDYDDGNDNGDDDIGSEIDADLKVGLDDTFAEIDKTPSGIRQEQRQESARRSQQAERRGTHRPAVQKSADYYEDQKFADYYEDQGEPVPTKKSPLDVVGNVVRQANLAHSRIAIEEADIDEEPPRPQRKSQPQQWRGQRTNGSAPPTRRDREESDEDYAEPPQNDSPF